MWLQRQVDLINPGGMEECGLGAQGFESENEKLPRGIQFP